MIEDLEFRIHNSVKLGDSKIVYIKEYRFYY